MKSKKGFMLGEYTLKIVIAVIVLLLLFYLLFRLYSTYEDGRNLELAEATLKSIIESMEVAKESGEEEVIVLNPTEKGLTSHYWSIVSWPYGNYKLIPESCDKNCVCICQFPNTWETEPFGRISDDLLEKCNSIGVCLNSYSKIKILNSGFLKVDGQIQIKNPPVNLKINYEKSKGFEIKQI